ncbi:MAG: hypothetical protein ACI8WB_005209 [Phenylobacterium sp.]|jgi:hypothetical protein
MKIVVFLLIYSTIVISVLRIFLLSFQQHARPDPIKIPMGSKITEAVLEVCRLEQLIIETTDFNQQIALIEQAKAIKAWLYQQSTDQNSTVIDDNVISMASFKDSNRQ